MNRENEFRKCVGLPTLTVFTVEFKLPDGRAQQIVDGVGDYYFLIIKKVSKRVQEFFARNSECAEILVGEENG